MVHRTRSPKSPDLGNLPDHQRCTKTAKSTGERCKRIRMTGLEVCRTHVRARGWRDTREKAKMEQALVKRGYGNREVDPSHPAAHPISGLAWEIRCTAGNIEMLKEKLAELRDKDIIQGQQITTRRDLNAELLELIGDVDYRDEDGYVQQRLGENYSIVREDQRLHLWAEMFMRERKHYAELLKLAFAVGFEERRVRLIEQQIVDMNSVITGVIRRLGRDPHDVEVRAMVREEILAIMPVPA